VPDRVYFKCFWTSFLVPGYIRWGGFLGCFWGAIGNWPLLGGYEMWNGSPLIRSMNPLISSKAFSLVGLCYLGGFRLSSCGYFLDTIFRHELAVEAWRRQRTFFFRQLGLVLPCLLAWHTRMPVLVQGWAIVRVLFRLGGRGWTFLFSNFRFWPRPRANCGLD